MIKETVDFSALNGRMTLDVIVDLMKALNDAVHAGFTAKHDDLASASATWDRAQASALSEVCQMIGQIKPKAVTEA